MKIFVKVASLGNNIENFFLILIGKHMHPWS